MDSITLDDIRIIRLGKGLWHKINCIFGNHKWKKGKTTYFYYYRYCVYCGKQQTRKIPRADENSFILNTNTKWESESSPYETDTQKACELAKKLSEDAIIVVNELSKFDSFPKQKTRTLMYLVNVTKQLSKKYMDLKTEIRKLHIKKQEEDLRDVETAKES